MGGAAVIFDADMLLAYSEWLDTQGLMTAPSDDDTRSHDDLVNEFKDDLTRTA